MIWEYLAALLNTFPWLMASVFLGVFAAEVLAQRGLFTKLGIPFAFLTRAANLPIQLSSALTAALLDSRAGHSILSSLYKEGKIRERHVISFALLSTPFVGTRLFVQFSLPVSLALLGVELTLVSFLLSLTSWLVAVAVGTILGRTSPLGVIEVEPKGGGRAVNYRVAAKKALRMCYYVGTRYLVVNAIILALAAVGVFSLLQGYTKSLATRFSISVYSAAIAAVYSAGTVPGMALAREFMSKGLATAKEALAGIVLGRFLFSLTSDYPRNVFPLYLTFYPAKLASKVLMFLVLYHALSIPLQLAIIQLLPLGS